MSDFTRLGWLLVGIVIGYWFATPKKSQPKPKERQVQPAPYIHVVDFGAAQ